MQPSMLDEDDWIFIIKEFINSFCPLSTVEGITTFNPGICAKIDCKL